MTHEQAMTAKTSRFLVNDREQTGPYRVIKVDWVGKVTVQSLDGTHEMQSDTAIFYRCDIRGEKIAE
ncbi:hypothetical protein LHV02_00435 [Limosilactobacillus fermentum]|uniref:hypothetical protein n=1 Tax=Limosilactobacillus fermentum TaxID=1613 RepID=UPI00165783ED|nr:hypothetical protein [Limosilactobacillus fermentum]MBC9021209.1 hypothetical protein [Limosilactobacillus fermentum CECT 5716]MCB4715027.1 hypothetical protein [Limosilactobacillus fermentum]MCH5396644.1 hypothetical protein [Limosilactobacillus fermentum]